MNRHQIRSEADALDYIADCTLATVSTLAGMKSRSAYEFKRQISIAQTAIDCIRNFKVTPTSRAATVINEYGCSVEQWAAHYDVKKEQE